MLLCDCFGKPVRGGHSVFKLKTIDYMASINYRSITTKIVTNLSRITETKKYAVFVSHVRVFFLLINACRRLDVFQVVIFYTLVFIQRKPGLLISEPVDKHVGLFHRLIFKNRVFRLILSVVKKKKKKKNDNFQRSRRFPTTTE